MTFEIKEEYGQWFFIVSMGDDLIMRHFVPERLVGKLKAACDDAINPQQKIDELQREVDRWHRKNREVEARLQAIRRVVDGHETPLPPRGWIEVD